MRVLVCGGRKFADIRMLFRVLDRLHEQTPFSCLIHGTARGADSLADAWGIHARLRIHRFPAHWTRLGMAAGPERNARMLAKATPDLVVAFPGGKGTKDMITKALNADVKVLKVRPDGSVVQWFKRVDVEQGMLL